jgi:hypothetical protein
MAAAARRSYNHDVLPINKPPLQVDGVAGVSACFVDEASTRVRKQINGSAGRGRALDDFAVGARHHAARAVGRRFCRRSPALVIPPVGAAAPRCSNTRMCVGG